ncbi:MAG: ABC transporter ATP-binding protein [Ruminococcaceae bacterium]|nr:ABC transporter ATP-binding protein [Oscillospiraceae bacterium]
MNKLFKYMSSYKKEAVLGPLFKLLEALFELFVPLVVADIIDIGIAKGQEGKGDIIKYMLLLVALAFVGFVFSVTAQYFAAKASVGFVTRIRHALFSHIGKLSYSELDKVGTAKFITRMTSDVNQVQTGMNLALRLLLRSPFVVFGAMIMAFTIDVKISLIFLVVIILLSVVVFGITLITMPLHKKVQTNLETLTHSTKENLTGARVIRAFCKEDDEVSSFGKNNDLFAKGESFVGKISALTNPLTFIIINTGIAVLVWSGSIKINIGTLSQGDVVALYNYMSQILVELVKLANLIVTISKSLACATRISDVLEIPFIEDKGEEYTSQGDVSFENVSFRYEGAGDLSLTGITFSAKEGETIGVIGGTGDGKTTLINLIPAFYKATEGVVKVGGKNVNDYSEKSLRSKIGIVPQKATLFHGSVRDNMKWGKKDATDEEIITALEIAQAKDFVMEKEGGLDFEIEAGGKNLSGGQRQRLTIARAIVGNPKILILDDSSSALDYLTDLNLRRAISTLPQNPTVFIVSQRASSVLHADKIIVLEDGVVVGEGTHKDLLDTCVAYKEIYDTQYSSQEGTK